MKKAHTMALVVGAAVLISWVFFVSRAEAYETYHGNGTDGDGRCATCHGDFRPSGPFPSLHDLHVGPFTGTCLLCHTSSDRENPFIMWSGGDSNGPGFGCVGCHGRDYGETIELSNGYDNGGSSTWDLNGLPKMSGYGLRRHHQNNGIGECIACHGDATPIREGPESDPTTQPPYYTRADVPVTGTCNTDGSEDGTGEPNGEDEVGLDNDGDRCIDGADVDCGGIEEICDDGIDNDCDGDTDTADPDCGGGGVCGDGTVDAGEDCDDGNTSGGDCCAADCTYEASGSTCGDPSVSECDNADTCNGAGACEDNFAAPGAACGDQGVECLVDDACDGAGACEDNGNQADGSSCGDPSDTSCDNPDSCLTGACESNYEAAGTQCPNGLYCDGDETCDGGGACQDGADPCGVGEICNEDGDVCEAAPACGDGTVDAGEDCDDGNTSGGDCCAADCTYEASGSTCGDPSVSECDNADTCNGAGACEDNFAAPGAACGDQGVECLANDTCDAAGVCVDNGASPDGTACGDGSSDQCDNADSCVSGVCADNFVPSGTACEDGLFCTVDDTCDGGGTCDAGGANPCADTVGCTDDSCDEAANACVNTANDANCTNGLFCDGSETCDAVDDCQSGTPPVTDDGVGCTDDSCDETNNVVVNVPNDGLCNNGQFCDGAETCDAVDDCQSGTPPCDPATETCDEAGDVCEPIGCQSDAECDNGEFCDGAETCDLGTGECLPGTPVDTDDGVGCTEDSCDEVNDVVVNAPNDGNCDNGAFCDGSETCDAVDDCQSGTPPVTDDGVGCTDDSCDEVNDVVVNVPNDGLCNNGQFCDGAETCDAVDDCQSGTPPCDPATETCDEAGDVCEPIGCQSDAECDNGEFCDGAETCNTGTGECLPGTPVDADDGVGCTDDSCDETNDVVVNAPNDGLCDNGQFCDGAETCDAVDDCQAGSPVDADDGVGCTDDSCDEVNDVVVNTANDGNCDNGMFCDGSETCDAVNDCQAGTDPCDPATETCDEVGDVCEPIGCQVDADCDNGMFCDGTETCDIGSGQCLPGTLVNADDGIGCTDDSCDEVNDVVVNAPNDGLCDNGDFCDGAETCDAVNDCQAGTPVDVDDGVGCTDDSCDEVNDVVVNAPNDGLCDNGDFCDGAEACDAVNDCQSGTPPCDPATETCDEVGDVCESIGCQVDADCDNGMFCDGTETCDIGSGQCLPGTLVNADDGIGCTDDSCDEVNDVVVNAPNDGLCDNGDFCDGAETCDAVNDCQAGTPVDVDDGVGCTDDSCDEVNDVVVNAPNDGLCDNGDFCDGAEACDAVNDCQSGTPPCDPATETCDEVGDVCEPIGCQVDAECDNGMFCDGTETCDIGSGQCLPGTLVNADDGIGCTDDSCDEVNDVVVNAPNDGLCDNGDFCDGAETCDAVNDCQAGTPVDVDDGVGCTDDSCDEVNDVVVNAPNDGLCDNGDFCDGAEACDAVNDCQSGTPPCDPATETCDEVGDVCEPIGCQSDAECDNGLFCDGAETCDLGTGECVSGTPVDCADGVSCTVDACNEGTDSCDNLADDVFCDNGMFCDGAEFCDPVLDCQAGAAPCDPATQSCNEEADVCEDTGGGKVVICHKGKKTLKIDRDSLNDHLGHGDSLGPCPGDSDEDSDSGDDGDSDEDSDSGDDGDSDDSDKKKKRGRRR